MRRGHDAIANFGTLTLGAFLDLARTVDATFPITNERVVALQGGRVGPEGAIGLIRHAHRGGCVLIPTAMRRITVIFARFGISQKRARIGRNALKILICVIERLARCKGVARFRPRVKKAALVLITAKSRTPVVPLADKSFKTANVIVCDGFAIGLIGLASVVTPSAT